MFRPAIINKNKINANYIYLIERLNPFLSSSIGKSFGYFYDHLKIAIIHCTDNFGFGMGLQNFDDFVYRNHRSEIIGYSAHSNFVILSSIIYFQFLHVTSAL